MAYMIVTPRDLFNDGNLLANYGKVYIELERHGLLACWQHESEGDVSNWDIQQDDDGNTWLSNIEVTTVNGDTVNLFRRCNTRIKWSLLYIDDQGEIGSVFNDECADDTRLSPLFLEFINGS